MAPPTFKQITEMMEHRSAYSYLSDIIRTHGLEFVPDGGKSPLAISLAGLRVVRIDHDEPAYTFSHFFSDEDPERLSNITDWMGSGISHHAFSSLHLDVAEMLYAFPVRRTLDGDTPAHWMAKHSAPNYNIIIDDGARLSDKEYEDAKAELQIAVSLLSSLPLNSSQWRSLGAFVQSRNGNQMTPFESAILSGNKAYIDCLSSSDEIPATIQDHCLVSLVRIAKNSHKMNPVVFEAYQDDIFGVSETGVMECAAFSDPNGTRNEFQRTILRHRIADETAIKSCSSIYAKLPDAVEKTAIDILLRNGDSIASGLEIIRDARFVSKYHLEKIRKGQGGREGSQGRQGL